MAIIRVSLAGCCDAAGIEDGWPLCIWVGIMVEILWARDENEARCDAN